MGPVLRQCKPWSVQRVRSRDPLVPGLLVLLHSELQCVGSTYLFSSVKILGQAGLKEKIPYQEWKTFNC